MNITILDYGVGNLGSVRNALERLGYRPTVTNDCDEIRTAEVLVVPGQGAAGEAMAALRQQHLIGPIRNFVASNRPYIGICLGFQLLFEFTEEDGGVDGLGIFKGRVKRFQSDQVKVPQMGWNELRVVHDPFGLSVSLPIPLFGYFANSYYVLPEDRRIVFTETDYGVTFASSIQTSTLFGCQFHPEKSGDVGLALLKGFLNRHAHQY